MVYKTATKLAVDHFDIAANEVTAVRSANFADERLKGRHARQSRSI